MLSVDGAMRGLESASSNAEAWDDIESKTILDVCSFEFCKCVGEEV